ncbi:MAG TPA: potassium transporter Kup, partial [Cryomorphaceae bacterium]|nr:potassium transporter Kup [Cryomorphaceae bacterium]
GTQGVGRIFGPIMLVWFGYLGLLGVVSIMDSPQILHALNPWYSIQFFMDHGWHGVLVLGSVFLVVTGGEALYADMGHFSKRSIRIGWFVLVLPALVLNYFGQGALLLRSPEAIDNPFYRMAPEWALYPSVVLATIATIIASQAIISGVFSLTYQAVNLGYFPRFSIVHTSAQERGQVYIPSMNWMLFVATAFLVLGFKTSSNLASAYGVAVSTTMVITTLLAFAAMIRIWKWKVWQAATLSVFFLIMDLAFFGANIFKIADGGWFPLLIAVLVYGVMSTWRKGKKILSERIQASESPGFDKWDEINLGVKHVIEGTAIYFSATLDRIPPPLLLNFRYNRVLHERVIILSVRRRNIPHIDFNDLLELEELRDHVYLAKANYGFKDVVSVNRLIPLLHKKIKGFDPDNVTYVVGTKDVIPRDNKQMWKWRKALFVFLQRNDASATGFFQIPPNKVIEIGSQMGF